MLSELTHDERQRDRRNRLHEIGRELSDAYSRKAALDALISELLDERRQTEAALLELPTGD